MADGCLRSGTESVVAGRALATPFLYGCVPRWAWQSRSRASARPVPPAPCHDPRLRARLEEPRPVRPRHVQPGPGQAPSPISDLRSASPAEAQIDTATVPDIIDVAYVNAVMAKLDDALGTIMREVRIAGEFGESFEAGMRSIYRTRNAEVQSFSFRKRLASTGWPRTVNPVTEVVEILESTSTCLRVLHREPPHQPVARRPQQPRPAVLPGA